MKEEPVELPMEVDEPVKHQVSIPSFAKKTIAALSKEHSKYYPAKSKVPQNHEPIVDQLPLRRSQRTRAGKIPFIVTFV